MKLSLAYVATAAALFACASSIIVLEVALRRQCDNIIQDFNNVIASLPSENCPPEKVLDEAYYEELRSKLVSVHPCKIYEGSYDFAFTFRTSILWRSRSATYFSESNEWVIGSE